MFCEKCGATMPQGSKFCENCGTTAGGGQPATAQPAAHTAQPAAYAAPPVYAPSPAYSQPQPQYNNRAPGYGSSHANQEPLTVGGYIGMFILTAIPFVNFICLLMWAFGGNTNLNKKNFARAALIISLIAAVLWIILAIIAAILGASLFDSLY